MIESLPKSTMFGHYFFHVEGVFRLVLGVYVLRQRNPHLK